MSTFSDQAAAFEDTLQIVLLERAALLQMLMTLDVPPEMKSMAGAMLNRISRNGKITEDDRKVLTALAREKIASFERVMGTLQKEGTFALMKVEKETLEQFILHLVFEAFQRKLSGKRAQDFDILAAADGAKP